MFKLESYITPLLMSYIDKYVKLKHEDFQLSLWGGDAVFNKLDLRLDAIEHMLNLPISFKSGHIYELRIHVPWTKLGSEPVVITINTIECIVRLRDYESSSASTGTSTSQSALTPQRVKIKKQDQEELPPGYLQSLITKVINNLNIVVNNLILKFVEDDIVLSVNAKSAECFSVNETWMRAFAELSLPELVLRKMVNFHDLTICLDKRNSDGKIEVYQDPLLYRCSLTCRIHMLYDNLYSSMPSVTKFNLLCDKLDISLTDTQLPMFCHLLEMCVAIYYGCIGPSETEVKETSVEPHADPVQQELATQMHHNEEDDQGWASWAWSYVPQILPTDAEEWEKQQSKRADNAILCVGIYITKGSISYKLTETHQETAYGVPKVSFHPCLVWEAEGLCTEVLVQGLTYVNAQMGITNSRVTCKGDAICGVKDLENTERDPCALRIGPPLSSKQNMAYDTNSLFDPGGVENQGERPSYVTKLDGHMDLFTEAYGQDRFGAVWMDYLYTMEVDNTTERRGSSASHSDEPGRENACLRFLIGPFNMVVSSSAMQRVMKMVTCALDHDYESYLTFPKDAMDEKCQPPTEEEVQAMEQFVPTRTYSVTLLKPCIWVKAADLPVADLKKRKVSSRRVKKSKKGSDSSSPAPVTKLPHYLPVVVFKAERMEYQLTRAMYPGHHVRRVSKMVAPSSDLLHHCHSHQNVKVFGFCTGLSKTKGVGDTGPVQTIIEPFSGVFYMKTLLYPECWNNPLQIQCERFYELPQFSVTLTKAQLMLVTYLITSWLEKNPNAASLTNTTLMIDVFCSEKKLPVSEICLAGLEVRECLTQGVYAVTATLTSLQAVMFHKANNVDSITPLLFGPLDTSKVPTQTFFTTPGNNGVLPGQPDCIVMTMQIPNNPNMPAGPGAFLIQAEGIVGCLDPVLHEWFAYVPKIRKTSSVTGFVESGATPGKGPTTAKTEGSTTETGTDGQGTKSYLLSSSRPGFTSTEADTTKQEEATSSEKTEERQLGDVLAHYWPLLKIMHIQVNIKNISFFFPLTPLRLQDPTMNILQNLQQVQAANDLPATLVLSCPSLKVMSLGQSQKAFPALQEIPISALDQSLSGDKTPWTIQLSDCSAYTIQATQKFHFILKPASMSATLAITTKYHPPTSDNITSLALGVHADMDLLAIGISQAQIQLLHDLAAAGVCTCRRVLESIETQKSLLNTDVVSTCLNSDVLKSLPTQSPSAPLNNTQTGLASSSSQWEPGDTLPQTITGTSEASVSRCTSPNKEGESSGSVKLSLWMQWTLPKLLMRIYAVGDHNLETCLQGVLEDLMTSIDLQEVYAKVKCKVEHVDVKHMVKNGLNSTWAPGDFEGVILTSLPKLNKEMSLAANRQWVSPNQPPINLFSEEDMKPRDSTHGFLNFTFTRAQRKNVKKKLKRMYDQKDTEDRRSSDDLSAADPGYLNEVCLSVQPCDIVVNSPVIANLLQLLSITTSCEKMVGAAADGASDKIKPKTGLSSNLPWLTCDILPLIYIDCSTVRVFIPKCNDKAAEVAFDLLATKQKPSSNPYHHDLLMLQILSITMTPQADNPLPRVIVNKEIYRKALKSSIPGQLGMDLEDRQYQLDVRGLSLSTGCWRHLVLARRKGSGLANQGTPVQHPALEWNNLVKNENEREEVKMLPLASSLDLRIVAAPAIVYKPTMATVLHSINEASVVCGYSLEVNATSDMDFFMSVAQMRMLLDLINTNGSHLKHLTLDSNQDGEVRSPMTPCGALEVNKESIMLQSESAPRARNESKIVYPNVWDQITPFSVLLTAGRISCMLYTHRVLKKEEEQKRSVETPSFVIGSPTLKRPKSKGSLELPEETMSTLTQSSADSGVESAYSSAVNDNQLKQLSLAIVPFLFATFSQPHTFISVQNEQQRADLSCYDIVLKGTKPGYNVMDDLRLLPEASDFGHHWIETRLGEADKKTGILPSLYTLSASNFLLTPAAIKLRLERPLKFNLSADRLSQAVGFVVELQKELQEGVDAMCDNVFSLSSTPESPSPEEPSPKPPYLATFTHLSKISMTTTQIMVAMETSSSSHQVGLLFSIGGFDSEVLFRDITENIKEIDFVVNLYDLILKTLYGTTWQTLIGPLPLSLTLNSQWLPHSGPSSLPRILCFLESSKVPICFGQENALCFIHLQEQIQQCLSVLAQLSPAQSAASGSIAGQKTASQSHRGSGKIHKVEPAVKVSLDDLRSGMFSYNTSTDEEILLPGVYEVTFHVDYLEGGGSMLWRYPEPRAITAVSSQPVPYNLPKQLDVRYIDETMMVPCILQYYNPLTKSFEDYQRFHISGSSQMTLTLPEVTRDLNLDDRNKVKVASIWRVFILHPKVEDSDYEFLLNLDPKQGSTLEPVIWPQTLAASLKVDSCFLPTLVPAVQVSFSADLVAVSMAHQLQTLSQEVPDKLKPFQLNPVAHSNQPYMEVNLEDPVIQVTYLGGQLPRADVQFSSCLDAAVLEYRNLTMFDLVERFGCHGTMNWQQHQQFSVMKSRVSVDPVCVKVGASVVHSLSTALQAWTEITSPRESTSHQIVPHHFLICNDTHHALRIGQADTDESIMVESRFVTPYSWRTHRQKQLLHLTLASHGGQWCKPINLDLEGNVIRVIEHKGQRSTLIIRVKQITGVQKQVIISGQLVICSRIDGNLEVKVVTQKPGVSGNEVSWTLEGSSTGASCVVEHEAVQAVRVRLQGVKMPWSAELPVCGEKVKDSKLVKIPMSDRISYLHVWCHIFYENVEDATQTAVIFAPLFVTRSHLPTSLLMNIDTPRLKNSMQIEVKGQGQEENLPSISGDMTHSITFQLSTAMKLSSPAISLSSGMSEQICSTPLEKVDVDVLAHHWRIPSGHVWPYNQLNKIKLDDIKSPIPTASKAQDIIVPQEASRTEIQCKEVEQPNIDLQICLQQRWPGFNTLLIDVAPYWFLVNDSLFDFVILESNDHQWYLPSGKTFAPPQFQDSFHIGLAVEDMLHLSDAITLSNEERTYKFMADIEMTLYRQCHLKVTIPIKQDSRVLKLCHLVLHSVIHDNMQIITIRNRYNVVNRLDSAFQLQCYSVPLTQQKLSVLHQERLVVDIPEKRRSPLVTLPFWNIPLTCNVSEIDSTRCVQYLYFKQVSSKHSKSADHLQTSLTSHMTWSQPMRVRISENGTRSNVSLQFEDANGRCTCKSYVVVCQEKLGMVFLTVEEEQYPAIEVHNHCACTLHFGQTLMGVHVEGITVQEEAELTKDLPTLPPGGVAHYAFPACNGHFPDVSVPSNVPKLHLAGMLESDDAEKSEMDKLSWSSGIDLGYEHDVFVTIPNICDVKVHVEKVGHTTHVFVDPVGRAEVSAREIRSRIKGKDHVMWVEEKKAASPPRDLYLASISRSSVPSKAMMIESRVICKNVSFVFLDLDSKSLRIQEVARVTFDEFVLSVVPNIEDSLDQMKNYEPHVKYSAFVAVGEIQLDNQLHSSGGYDFHVLFIREDYESKRANVNHSFFDDADLRAVTRQQGLLVLDLELCQDLVKSQLVVEGVTISAKPTVLFLEDTFLYEVLKRIDKCMPVSLSTVDAADRMLPLPEEVLQTAMGMCQPVRLQKLIVQPISMKLSLHASLKVFVALDNAPLSFGVFQRDNLFTVPSWFLHALLMHYVAATLFRAGWVVGSLEILGSPSGFVRHLTNGIMDLFRMPYNGIMRGPGAFLGGLVGGVGSLLRNVSTGTLTSVTNFASSVSRNMDRLSLDAQHFERQEEGRRRRPSRVSDGLRQGMEGFALSLLGAIAGLADQPLQTLYDERKRGAGQAATGLVSGLGKGLVGVVTKPLGGAAELVSQTGYGLLHGVGLTHLPQGRCQPADVDAAELPNSFQKYIQKILHTYPDVSLLASVNVTKQEGPRTETESEARSTLLLTAEILFLYSNVEDAQQQAYAMSQITCEADDGDPTMLYISIRDPFVGHKDDSDEDMNSKDRVAAFVNNAATYGGFHGNKKHHYGNRDHSKRTIEFKVDPKHRDSFIATFNIAKYRALGVGFPV